MSEIKLSGRYAKALLNESKQKGNEDVVFQDLTKISASISQSADLATLLKSPVVNKENKKQILSKVFPEISTDTSAFINFLVEKNRERYLADIAQSFIGQYYNFKNITLLEITSTVVIEDNTINRIIESVKQQLNLKEVKVTTKVDERIIGGLVLKIGERTLDASIASRLENFKRVLTA